MLPCGVPLGNDSPSTSGTMIPQPGREAPLGFEEQRLLRIARNKEAVARIGVAEAAHEWVVGAREGLALAVARTQWQ